MERFHNPLYNFGYLLYRWMKPVCDPIAAIRALPGYFTYARDWMRYGRLPGAEPRRIIDSAPMLGEATATTPFDRHYFYQDTWAFSKIVSSGAKLHVDVASRIDLVGFLTAVCEVKFVDIRPLRVDLPHFESVNASILGLPFDNNSVKSLSCLHVVEHIGLGRYGDSLDPEGSAHACRELERVLAPRGNLYFSCPVGKPRVCFNAHRIHSVAQILSYFSRLDLVEFSGIDDQRRLRRNAGVHTFDESEYACGLFHFTKGRNR